MSVQSGKGLAVIFDMDGVLVNSYAPHFASWRHTAQERGLDMTEAQFESHFGRTSREIIRDVWGPSFTDAELAAWDRDKEAVYREILLEDFPAMPGACDLLIALHEAGFQLAIGSSGPPENVACVREKLPCANLFEACVSGTDVKHGKPHPDVFLTAAKRLGLLPRLCAVIEDSMAGLQAARRAKMTPIAITGTTPREQLETRSVLTVDSLTELSPPIVAKLIQDRKK
ncbi:MAG: HAD family phosphatase [Lentisphaerae bacterium]|nr:HAD family phosphatase [Lentisphaerota bacterium]